MSQRIDLPPFEIVYAEDASHAAAKRLRVYVAIRPEDTDKLGAVAAEIVRERAATNDVVMLFFHFSPAAAGRTPAEARAQYVRNGMRQGYRPAPLTSDRDMVRLTTPTGMITVESARQA